MYRIGRIKSNMEYALYAVYMHRMRSVRKFFVVEGQRSSWNGLWIIDHFFLHDLEVLPISAITSSAV